MAEPDLEILCAPSSVDGILARVVADRHGLAWSQEWSKSKGWIDSLVPIGDVMKAPLASASTRASYGLPPDA